MYLKDEKQSADEICLDRESNPDLSLGRRLLLPLSYPGPTNLIFFPYLDNYHKYKYKRDTFESLLYPKRFERYKDVQSVHNNSTRCRDLTYFPWKIKCYSFKNFVFVCLEFGIIDRKRIKKDSKKNHPFLWTTISWEPEVELNRSSFQRAKLLTRLLFHWLTKSYYLLELHRFKVFLILILAFKIENHFFLGNRKLYMDKWRNVCKSKVSRGASNNRFSTKNHSIFEVIVSFPILMRFNQILKWRR